MSNKAAASERNRKTNPEFLPDTADMSLIQKVWDSFAQAISRFWYIVVATWLLAAFVAFEGYSKQKALWNDEILVRWVDTLPSVRDIWPQLKFGVCADPPLFHLLTHGLVSVFGSGASVLRFPSMVGVCVMLLSIFFVLRQQIGPLYALLGFALPFCTILPQYAYEARPYGLMYGCLGIAVYCWAKLGKEDVDRVIWNIGLGLALTATLACHFYSVFALPAFYLGEVVRTARRHRVSWPTVAALMVSTATEGFYWPIIVGIRKLSSNYFEKPTLRSVPGMLHDSLPGLVIPIFAFLFLVAIFWVLNFRFTRPSVEEADGQFRDLAALALGFLLIPLLAWGAGIVFLKAFTTRYVLHGLYGVFILLPLFAARVFNRDRSLGLAMLLACGLPTSAFLLRGALANLEPQHCYDAFLQLEQALPNLDGDIVVSDPLVFTQVVNYSPALKARCIALWDRENELKYTGIDEVSLGAEHGVELGWYRAQAWSDYRQRNQAFLFLTVSDGESDLGWLRDYLKQAGRYGNVVLSAGPYLVVKAKPLEIKPAAPSLNPETKPRTQQPQFPR